MKRIFLFIAILFSVVASAQKPPNYLYQGIRSRVINNMADSGVTTVPLASPRIPGGTSAQAGLMVVDTVSPGKGFWYLMDGTFHHLTDSSYVGDSLARRLTRLYRKTASDSVFSCINGTCTFAFKDSTGGGSGGLSGGNLQGGGYRIYFPDSSALKNLSPGALMIIDSLTAKVLKLSVDTASMVRIDTAGAPSNGFLQRTGARTYAPVSLTTSTTIGTTPILSGTAQSMIYESSSNKFAETANFTFDGTKVLNIPATGSYKIGGLGAVNFPDQTNFAKTEIFSQSSPPLDHSGGGLTGQYNTIVGHDAAHAFTSANRNTALGTEAMYSSTTAVQCTAVGVDALYSPVTGATQCTAVGMSAMQNAGNGISSVTSVGFENLMKVTGNFNQGFGHSVMHENTSGTENVAVGYFSLYYNQTGIKNTVLGSQALEGASTMSNSDNLALAYKALFANTTGSDNTAAGYQSLINNTTGGSNVALGANTGGGITTGSHVLALGDNIASFAAGETGTVAIGSNALRRIWINGNGQTKIGGSITNSDTSLVPEVADVIVNGKLKIKTVNAGSSLDSIPAIENGIITAVNLQGGEYTPTIASTTSTNVASSTSGVVQYTRDGDRIHVEGSIGVTATTTLLFTSISVTLPVASAMTLSTDLSGVASCQTASAVTAGFVSADTGNDVALVNFYPNGTSTTVYFSFTYKVK